MLPKSKGVIWTQGAGIGGGGGEEEEDDAVSWTTNDENSETCTNEFAPMNPSLSNFKSLLETDWYINNPQTISNYQPEFNTTNFCSYPTDYNLFSQPFTLDPSQSLLPPKSCFSSVFNVMSSHNNPFDNGLDLSYHNNFLATQSCFNGLLSSQTQFLGSNTSQLSPTSEFTTTHLLPTSDHFTTTPSVNFEGSFEGSSGNLMLQNRTKMLRPLEALPEIGEQPTLFQKRAALRQNSIGDNNLGGLEKKRKRESDDGLSFDGVGLNYDDSDEGIENMNGGDENITTNNERGNENENGNGKGKKATGMPAKNLMAERRRRKKLNDRLYMLRSVVPKISKMDRASILGDAIDYLKELLQRINDLHNELEATPQGSFPPPTTSFHPLTPTPPTLPYRVKEELCASSLPSPKNQPARVEVRVREGRAVNIHMFCARRPGLLLSTMRALDNLGLDIQQAVISCFNGFALDIFRAECREGHDVLPEQIKAVLLDSAGLHGVM